MTAKPNVTIIDARELRRASIASLLKTWAEPLRLDIVSVAPGLDELRVDPDCQMVVLSLGAESLSGRETLQRLKILRALAPEAALIIISDCDRPEEVSAALEAGVNGFVPTDLDVDLALQAFSFILNGGSYFPPSAIRRLSDQVAPPQSDASGDDNATASDGNSVGGRRTFGSGKKNGAAVGNNILASVPNSDSVVQCQIRDEGCTNLTMRELDVLRLVEFGLSNKAIARRLGMTDGTVKVHVGHIMRKLGASNRTQIAVWVAGRGLSDPDHKEPESDWTDSKH